jgi:hypothetical protein
MRGLSEGRRVSPGLNPLSTSGPSRDQGDLNVKALFGERATSCFAPSSRLIRRFRASSWITWSNEESLAQSRIVGRFLNRDVELEFTRFMCRDCLPGLAALSYGVVGVVAALVLYSDDSMIDPKSHSFAWSTIASAVGFSFAATLGLYCSFCTFVSDRHPRQRPSG